MGASPTLCMSDNTDKDDQMKIKIFLTLIFILSMLMVSTGEEGTFEIVDTIEDVDIELTVNYDADICVGGAGNTNYFSGNYDVDGTADISDETYNVNVAANGWICMEGDEPTSNLLCAALNVDGKAYQNGETQYLYKDENKKYYGHIESGYYVDGYIEVNINDQLYHNLCFEEYSMYVTTKSKPIGEFTLSSPVFGLGYKGSVAGDHIPELFTYRDQNTWKKVVSETYPENHNGPVICTPARIAGEPLVLTGYWDTAKGLRVLQWKAANTA